MDTSRNTTSSVQANVSKNTSIASGRKPSRPKLRNDIINIFNWLVIIGCILVISGLSVEAFHNSEQIYHQRYIQLQFWVCIVFLLDFFIRFFFSEHKLRFIALNFIFLLVSIPYLQILEALQITLSTEAEYMLRIMPFIRGGYGLVLIIDWITQNRVTSLMVSYGLIILSLTYLSSLVLYSLEHAINPMLTSFGDSLSWAFMNVTTVGSNIIPITATGKILAVVLAASGMMMFPIFTVYITSLFQTHWNKESDKRSDRDHPKNWKKLERNRLSIKTDTQNCHKKLSSMCVKRETISPVSEKHLQWNRHEQLHATASSQEKI